MSTMSFVHRFAAGAAVAALTGTTALAAASAQAAPALADAPAAAPATVTVQAARGRGAGFRPVALPRAARGAEPLAVHSPSSSQTWVAARRSDGTLLLLQSVGKRWNVFPTTTRVSENARVVIDGDTAREVWVAAEGSLLRFDGRRWRNVSQPGLEYTTVKDQPGPGALVGTKPNDNGFPFIGKVAPNGRHTETAGWKWALPPTAAAKEVGVLNGTTYAFMSGMHSKFPYTGVFAHRDGAWTEIASLGTGGYSGDGGAHAFIRDRGGYLVFGQGAKTSPSGGFAVGSCVHWKPSATNSWGEYGNCATLSAVSAADRRSDGRIVLGGKDAKDENGDIVQGTFRLRSNNGAERIISGDPGDATVSITAQPRTNTAWAVTTTDGTNTLQRWVR